MELPQKNRDQLVARLEELTQDVRDGRVTNVAFTALTHESNLFDEVVTFFEDHGRYSSLLGAVSMLHYDMVTKADRSQVEKPGT